MKRVFIFLFSLILLTSCIFTAFNEGEMVPPSDVSFIQEKGAPAIDFIQNTAFYDWLAFSSDGYGNISIYSFINPENPTLISHTSIPTNQVISKIEVDSDYNLYLATGNDGVFIVSASNLNNPSVICHDNNINARDLSFQSEQKGNFLAVADVDGWRMYQYMNSFSLIEVGRYYQYYQNERPQRIFLRRNWVFVFNQNSLDIFDATNTSRIERINTFFYSNIADFVDFDFIKNGSEEYLAVATRSNLYFFDITNPLNTTMIRDPIGFNKTPRTIRYHQGKLYICCEDRDVSVYVVYSVTSLSYTDEKARKSFPQVMTDVDFFKDFVYFSSGTGGLRVFRVVI